MSQSVLVGLLALQSLVDESLKRQTPPEPVTDSSPTRKVDVKFKDVRPEPFTSQIRCDRCGLLAARGEVDFHEMTCIDAKAGEGSIFGDGSTVQVDLCQHCLKFTLGRWLRVIDPEKQRLPQEQLDQFDLKLHGGEFPTGADRSLRVPDDLPVQERQAIDGSAQAGRTGSPTQRANRKDPGS